MRSLIHCDPAMEIKKPFTNLFSLSFSSTSFVSEQNRFSQFEVIEPFRLEMNFQIVILIYGSLLLLFILKTDLTQYKFDSFFISNILILSSSLNFMELSSFSFKNKNGLVLTPIKSTKLATKPWSSIPLWLNLGPPLQCYLLEINATCRS